MYPRDKRVINLLNLSDLKFLAKMFGTRVPKIADLSTILPDPKIYIEEENKVEEENLPDKIERIQQIRRQFYNNLYKWQLTLKGNNIVSIKLSTLVELVKVIVGRDCFINLLDFSCNSPTIYIPKEQETLKQYALKEGDIEMGITKLLEGGRRRRTKKKRKFGKKTV